MSSNAKLKYRQPYRLSKFDEVEGEVERYELGEHPHASATPVIMVDRKGFINRPEGR